MRTFGNCFCGLVVPALLSALVYGCGKSSSAGPIDGTFNLTSWTCGTTDVYRFLISGTVTAIKLTVSGSTGNTAVTYAGGCTRTQPFTATYPSSGSATLVEATPNCSSVCTNQCNGYTGTTSAYNYNLTGQALTTTRTLSTTDVSQNQVLQGAGCTAGQVETRTLAKQ